ncbi:Sphingosine-1-phosphate lyase [Vitis vinifera]|uniref:sphinganine-1-phosphate aldolase n=1 Tax=Vitis vinifera TaxID=29760 RepID=A0A438DX19_VITVI|nr:Sphingosine-1-phosphate lyase [Vitis vinifera]
MESSFFSHMRAAANSFLSEYEPLNLLLAPLLALLIARILQCFVGVVNEKGLKATILGFLITSVKLVPGVKRLEAIGVASLGGALVVLCHVSSFSCAIRYFLSDCIWNLKATILVGKKTTSDAYMVVDKLQSGSKSKRDGWSTELPRTGLGEGVIEKMKEEKRNDVVWQGKCSGTVYIGGSESEGHFSLINEACSMFAHTNPLHMDVFQSVVRFEVEVVAMTAALLGSKEKASGGQICGNMTSGGTESILLAVKTSRDYMKAKRGITRPEMIIPESAHSAYDKAAQYFNIKLLRVPVNKEFQADVKGIRRRINKNTILIVGSAPGFHMASSTLLRYELGELASSFGICFHVDLCLGGFVLPFARKLGYGCTNSTFDFSVEGVTSISVDVHKYGLAPKGTSVVLYRNHDIRKVGVRAVSHQAAVQICVQHQFVAVTEWSGGLYVFSNHSWKQAWCFDCWAWAAMISLGQEGYLNNTRETMEVSKKLQRGIKDIPELFVIGRPDMTIVAFGSNVVDIFEVNDILSSKGWHLNALQRPNSIHICLTLQHVTILEDFLKDLKESVQTVKQNPGPINGGLAPIYGAAGKMPDRGMVGELLVNFMDGTC